MAKLYAKMGIKVKLLDDTAIFYYNPVITGLHLPMTDLPFRLELEKQSGFLPSKYDNHTVRRLSAMKDQFLCQEAYNAMLSAQDPIVYEVYEIRRPELAGELRQGISIVHPGKVGNEYYMTKGHFHVVLGTAETYFCLQGHGYLVMETPEGHCRVEPIRSHTMLYVPPRWAHRSVNTSCTEDLVTFFVYPAEAGHDYSSIEKRGYRKLVIERDGIPTIIDNPRWVPREYYGSETSESMSHTSDANLLCQE